MVNQHLRGKIYYQKVDDKCNNGVHNGVTL